eukprot:superscaffoldBa00005349_g20224
MKLSGPCDSSPVHQEPSDPPAFPVTSMLHPGYGKHLSRRHIGPAFWPFQKNKSQNQVRSRILDSFLIILDPDQNKSL